jgi:hypothetical protein
MVPPVTGPTAVESPTVAPKKPNARPRSAPENSCWISAEFCGAIAPAARPWHSRAAISHPVLGAAPASALNRTNALSASMNIRRRPKASPSRPAGTRASPKVRAYPETTHCTPAASVPSARWIDGSATETMLTSSRLMNPAVSATERAFQRRGSTSSDGAERPWVAVSVTQALLWAVGRGSVVN